MKEIRKKDRSRIKRGKNLSLEERIIEKLEDEDNASEVVNELLRKHYKLEK